MARKQHSRGPCRKKPRYMRFVRVMCLVFAGPGSEGYIIWIREVPV